MSVLGPYNVQTSTNVTTIDIYSWHKIRVNGLRGLFVIREWIRDNKDKLEAGYQVEGNRIFLQSGKDAIFCKLTIKTNADDE